MSNRPKSRHPSWLRLLIALTLIMLRMLLVGYANRSNTTLRTTSPTHAATVPTLTGLIITPNPLNLPSGSGHASGLPTSWVHLTIGGSLSGTLTITGVAQSEPIPSGDNPYQLYFFLEDAQGPALLLEVHNYVGPGHYRLHSAISPLMTTSFSGLHQIRSGTIPCWPRTTIPLARWMSLLIT